ncbi:hypothetical protein HHI36_008349 [Cryptolaemus montrouzieri]|uniref:AB hydrolase-1 domain-containing protein n=1 Tax=Cryptolaemus montrouzieri TaxID=559131 RepID=A0ABD2MSA9_9CUCU
MTRAILLGKELLCLMTSKRRLHIMKPFSEINIPVPWGKIAGKWWGPTECKPIVCLHGIEDNCGTFDRLIPTLRKDKNISFLAIDFPGHGYSSPLPNGMFYHFLNFVLVLDHIRDYFQWSTVSLMGHSLGSITSFCYTLVYPEKVNFLICIDAIIPSFSPVTASYLRMNIEKFKKYMIIKDEPLAYTYEEVLEKVTSVFNGSVSREAAPCLLERKIACSKKYPGKYFFTRDPVLKANFAFNWPHEQMLKDISSIDNPIFMCKSKQSPYFGSKDLFHKIIEELKRNSRDCEFLILDGTHHIHLNEPKLIGAHIDEFLKKHYLEEKSNLEENSGIFCESPSSPLKIKSKI